MFAIWFSIPFHFITNLIAMVISLVTVVNPHAQFLVFHSHGLQTTDRAGKEFILTNFILLDSGICPCKHKRRDFVNLSQANEPL